MNKSISIWRLGTMPHSSAKELLQLKIIRNSRIQNNKHSEESFRAGPQDENNAAGRKKISVWKLLQK